MSKKAVLISIFLVTTGILFGAVLIANYSGVRFNTTAPYTPSEGVESLNDAFQKVSAIVTPQVVSITVKAKVELPKGHFWPFGDVLPDQGQSQEQEQQGSGSGIILTKDGYILTNRHVIEGAVEDGIHVTLHDTRVFEAKLIGKDVNTDIAVIKIDATDLPEASLANSDDVKVGEWVLAVGDPLGILTSTVTAGIVSAISRSIGIMRSETKDNYGIENFIQTDAAINPGNSGGALVDLHGQVIGMNTAIASPNGSYTGYGFAIPINIAKVVAQAIIKDGKFVRGYIGVKISNLNASKAKALGMNLFKGALVESLVEDGAGKAAGIKEGDVIVEVEGKPIESSNQLQARIGMHHPGETVSVRIWRKNTYLDLSVKLKGRDNADEADEETADANDAGQKKNDKDGKTPLTYEKAGFTVQPLDDAAKAKFKRKNGVYISGVKQMSKAWESGLRGDLVVFEAIRNGEKISIDNVSDFKKFSDAVAKGESVLLRVQTSGGDTNFIPLEGPLK